MTQDPRAAASAEQRRAADPGASAFVGASAGSGKTKLLTDRLLRLMLAGTDRNRVDPGRIQCLTFTRAAAAEMAVRLQSILGRWVSLPDAALDTELTALAVTPSAENRARARALFATVLDLPGGMRIGTIHAFCQSLLRRFPLEAALSPHFRLIEDRDADGALAEAREAMLAGVEASGLHDAMRLLAGQVQVERFGGLIAALQKRGDAVLAAMRDGPAALAAAQRRALGLDVADEAALMEKAVRWRDERRLRQTLLTLAGAGSPKIKATATTLLDWLSQEPAVRVAEWPIWRAAFLTERDKPRAASSLVNDRLAAQQPELLMEMQDEAARVWEIEDDRRALRVAELSAALVRLAGPVLRGYTAHKDANGLLDYDDLIARARGLLHNPGVAWVLYKLDGGIDHLLLDEVQDTAPEQWQIAEALTEEFFAGEGAHDPAGAPPRSVFAVGDRKQSIYSFQGADAAGFDDARDRLGARVLASGRRWVDGKLDVSFRSTAPVLALVDAVFAHRGAAQGVTMPGETLRHLPARAGAAGTVELWPLAPPPEPDDADAHVVVAARNRGQVSAPQRLAEALADWILRQTRDEGMAPGDILVLVRRRNAFTGALLKALKARGVPVGGLDRLVLTQQPAVQDLMALGDALLLPQDDLVFASLLTSPLGGLCDDSLMALAMGRNGAPLWETLRARAPERDNWQAAWDFFASLLRRVDHVTPYALFAEALGRLGGRARLFARLGPEAADPIDELLAAALTYQDQHAPSLQGFLHWLRQSGAEVKREQEAAGGVVRIMTAHGAKGQEARVVILPDTTGLPPAERGIDWARDPATGADVPLWAPRQELNCRAISVLRAAATARRMEEHNRLLYVALTRAQDRLLVCGAAGLRAPSDMCWYSLVSDGFAALETETETFAHWEGTMLRHASPGAAAARPAERATAPAVDLPPWAGAAPHWVAAPPPAEPDRPMPLAPSRPDDVALGSVPPAASPLAGRDAVGRRFLRGRLIHSLLQHLPSLPEAARPAAARAWLDRPGHGLAPGAASAIAAEVMAILSHPDLAPLFGPGSRAEVPLTGMVGGLVVGGLVDRLAVLDDAVLVADFKTNRDPPVDPADTPVLYLRQMAAYRAVLRGIFPDLPVRCALVWTQAARVSMLADQILDPHDPDPRGPNHAHDAA
jgi:ATP-dependent helicase/nuclease subunit A